ncbi:MULTISPECIES: phosphoribosylanthranilate isomerase [Inquilinus]|uniref:N-(5'-phosphoribosyl)anthranilate isomerase n=1 Tax=Inquilinus ginsengisoli TaxID=363840 RepID=A0ABU1JSA8_9PROT|nr:phosphoribosylanthranilate isomerase [Inquilinus ginsengisoli]MDR6291512.1 phosphoribosylanthranilate isomerase [Inquilinus ginsengisoli]
MSIDTKICGIRTPEVLEAAAKHGARWVGFNFYPPSPRSVAPDLGAELARMVPTGLRSVGLFVDPADDELEAVLGRVPLDMIQLHGGETPERVAEIKARWAMPVMKAIKIATVEDLAAIPAYAAVSDRLLFDAKPPKGVVSLPGGNGLAFDWSILSGRTWAKPWMLAGGLTEANVAEAVARTGATVVDVSSSIEERPGHKTPERVERFLAAVRAVAVMAN